LTFDDPIDGGRCAYSSGPPPPHGLGEGYARLPKGHGWAAALVGLLPPFSWVPSAVARFEAISHATGWAFFLPFAVYHALQGGLFTVAARFILDRRRGPAGADSIRPARPGTTCIVLASLWVILEWAFPKVIPWAFGSAMASSPILRQGADVAGVYGLSFAVVLVNALLALAIGGGLDQRARLRAAGGAVAMLVALVGYGAFRLGESSRPPHSPQQGLNVAVMQGGLPSGRFDVALANHQAWQRYSDMTGRIDETVDLVVWPETILRVYLRNDLLYRPRLLELANRLGRPIILGSLDAPSEGSAEELNSAYLIEPSHGADPSDASPAPSMHSQSRPQVYHKSYLLPFGEYVPAIVQGWFANWQTTGNFVHGEAATALSVRLRGQEHTVRFAPSICFEILQPGWFNEMTRAGAGFLVNLTDDGWFGHSTAPYQHLEFARMRAVETRRWLVRASNSGISAVIDPTGAVIADLGLDKIGTLSASIRTESAQTLYVLFGEWIVWLSLTIVTVWVFGLLVRPTSARTATSQVPAPVRLLLFLAALPPLFAGYAVFAHCLDWFFYWPFRRRRRIVATRIACSWGQTLFSLGLRLGAVELDQRPGLGPTSGAVPDWAEVGQLSGSRSNDCGSAGDFPRRGPFLIVCNHQSLLDIPLLFYLFRGHPIRFVLKRELKWGIPNVSPATRAAGYAFLDRRPDARERNIVTLKTFARALVEEGASGVIFPEGTWDTGGNLLPLRATGMKVILAAAPLDVVPVVIDGTWHAQRFRDLLRIFGRLRIKAVIGPPIPAAAAAADVDALLVRIESYLRSTLDRLRKEAREPRATDCAAPSDRLPSEVAEVMNAGSADILVVRDGKREHLIPLIADVIESIDTAGRAVVVKPIPGLLDEE